MATRYNVLYIHKYIYKQWANRKCQHTVSWLHGYTSARSCVLFIFASVFNFLLALFCSIVKCLGQRRNDSYECFIFIDLLIWLNFHSHKSNDAVQRLILNSSISISLQSHEHHIRSISKNSNAIRFFLVIFLSYHQQFVKCHCIVNIG